MQSKHRRKKCLGCQKWFTPDPRSQDRQRFCSKAACKQASKAWRQRRWWSKPANQNYWRGDDEVDRGRAWRMARGYIKRLLENSRVLRYLRDHHGDLLTEFEGSVAAELV